MKACQLYQLVEHPTYGQGVVLGKEFDTAPDGSRKPSGRVAIHFEPHPLPADPAYCWLQELNSPGPEILGNWVQASDIPLAWCWLMGTIHAAYGWAPSSPSFGALGPYSEAQKEAYLRGYNHKESRS